MNRRQYRMQRIADVEQEYLAARTAAKLLEDEMRSDPSFGGRRGWKPGAGAAFMENLAATYIIRLFAEFEAGLRDYWRTHCRRRTQPPISHLIRGAIPNQLFSQDCIDDADRVRKFRNALVHGFDHDAPEQVQPMTVSEAKKYLCTYFDRLDPGWR